MAAGNVVELVTVVGDDVFGKEDWILVVVHGLHTFMKVASLVIERGFGCHHKEVDMFIEVGSNGRGVSSNLLSFFVDFVLHEFC
jgi:hypothetical protein